MPGNVVVHPSTLSGRVSAPGSKSEAQRAVACAVLAEGPTTIHRMPGSDDTVAALRMARALGCGIKRAGGRVVIQPGAPDKPVLLNAGESGLAMRLFAAISARFDVPVMLTADGTLQERPMDMVTPALEALGASCWTRNGKAPLEVKGPITGGTVTVDGTRTSQLVSGLLIALTGCDADSTIHAPGLVSRPYVDMTIAMLSRFGGQVTVDGDAFHIPGGQRTQGVTVTVPGDWSGAAAMLVAGAIAGRVTVTGLDRETDQADRAVLEALAQAGADVQQTEEGTTVSRADLRAFHMDLTACPDLAPVLAVLGACCAGTSVLTGTARLAIKESDRAAGIGRLLAQLGGQVTVEADHIVIQGGRLKGGTVDSAGDHRMAMAAGLAGLVADGPVTIAGARAVSKSYPEFFEELRRLGADIEMDPS